MLRAGTKICLLWGTWGVYPPWRLCLGTFRRVAVWQMYTKALLVRLYSSLQIWKRERKGQSAPEFGTMTGWKESGLRIIIQVYTIFVFELKEFPCKCKPETKWDENLPKWRNLVSLVKKRIATSTEIFGTKIYSEKHLSVTFVAENKMRRLNF